jgi:hypothetical protein
MNDDKIEQHLNRLRAQLSGCSDNWRRDQITELKTHIESLYNTQLACGLSPNDAMDAALEKIGDPEKIGKELTITGMGQHRSTTVMAPLR